MSNVTDIKMLDRLDKLLDLDTLNEWERGFCKSMRADFVLKGKKVSNGQLNVIERTEKRAAPQAVAARTEWKNSWDAEKKELWVQAVKYYIAHMPMYFKGSQERYAKDSDYVPSENEYNKIVNNAYIKRWRAALSIPPKFHKGQLVTYYGLYLATVVSVGVPTTGAKGHREYQIYIPHADFNGMFAVNELRLKKFRPSMARRLVK